MKTVLSLFFSLLILPVCAQSEDEAHVRATVDAFFDAFHAQDSVAMKKKVHPNVILQTIGKDKNGKELLITADFNKFLKSIVAIPSDTPFKEKLTSYTIKVDGAMSNAWVGYEFWYNNTFSHCGVNSLQLFKSTDGWKIIYLIDTRRNTKCIP